MQLMGKSSERDAACLQHLPPGKRAIQACFPTPQPLIRLSSLPHQHNPTLCHSTFHTHLTDQISNTQCPLAATTPTDSNHLPPVFFFLVVVGGGATSFRCTLTKIFLGGFLMGSGMCQIWNDKIWCKENLVPVFQIELIFLAQNTRHTWMLTSGCCFLWTFHWLQLFPPGY